MDTWSLRTETSFCRQDSYCNIHLYWIKRKLPLCKFLNAFWLDGVFYFVPNSFKALSWTNFWRHWRFLLITRLRLSIYIVSRKGFSFGWPTKKGLGTPAKYWLRPVTFGVNTADSLVLGWEKIILMAILHQV